MNEKLNIQDLIDMLATKHGMNKKDADSFVRAFFQLIEESLEQDKYVKIRGLGTFKLINVGSRESINVNTGERIEIQGHTKISFTPEPALKNTINRPFSCFESVVLNEGTVLEDTPQETEGEGKEENESDASEAEPLIIEPFSEAEVAKGETEAAVEVEETEADSIGAEVCSAIGEVSSANPQANSVEIQENDAEPEFETEESEEKVTPEENEIPPVPKEEWAVSKEPPVKEEAPVASEEKLIAPEAEPIAFETEPIVPETESIVPETELIVPEAEPVVPEAEPVASEEQTASEETEEVKEVEIPRDPAVIKAKREEAETMRYFIGIVVFVVFLCGAAITFIYSPDLLDKVTGKPLEEELAKVEKENKSDSIYDYKALAGKVAVKDSLDDIGESVPEDTVLVTMELETQEQITVAPPPVTKPAPSTVPAKEVTKDDEQPMVPNYDNSYEIVGTEDTYTIKEGDMLTRIALHYYGTKLLWPYIVKHNPATIKNPNHVPCGTAIKIPKLAKKKKR